MRRFGGGPLTAALAASAVLASCEQQDAAVRVCVDAQGRRTPDAGCATSPATGGYRGGGWYYLGGANRGSGDVPPVGGQVLGGSYTPDPTATYAAAPEEGVSRGGFGSPAAGLGGREGKEGGGRGGAQ